MQQQSAAISSQVTVTDPLNTQATTNFQTLFSTTYPIEQSQAAGSGCPASLRRQTYDANANPISQDDFNGNRTCSAFDLSRNLESSRVEGLSGETSCSTVTASNAALPTGSRKISSQWHPDWRVKINEALPGQLTTWVYNGQPDPFNSNALASCAPSTALLPDGKPIAVLCKLVEQATTDANGHLGFSATLQLGVPNRQWSWTYDALGQMLTAKRPRTDINGTSTYSYYSDTTADHTMGDLQSITDEVGDVTQLVQYNKHGQVLQSVNPNGVVTLNTYDARQRLTSSSTADEVTSLSYDGVGQLKKITFPDASFIGYEYDDAHRLIAVSDDEGNRIEYVLDNAGNRTAENVKDPAGHLKQSLSRVMDPLGRVQQTTGRE